MKRDTTEFQILPAFHGDCILIKTYDSNKDEFIILVDGGTAQTFKYALSNELKDINKINLLVLTHIDSDHIGGLINFFKSRLLDTIAIEEIWMNHPEIVEVNTGKLISTKQGDTLKNLIQSKIPNVNLYEISTAQGTVDRSGIKFTILSPTLEIKNELHRCWQSSKLLDKGDDKVNISLKKESYSHTLEELSRVPFSPQKTIFSDIMNSSSITFLLKCFDMSVLLLADSRPEVVAQSLISLGFSDASPLEVDFTKISHHGSSNNTSQELLSLIKCENYIISTNGGTAKHRHPSRETIARLVYSGSRNSDPINIYFNYDIESLKARIGHFINDNDFAKGNWNVKSQNRFIKNGI